MDISQKKEQFSIAYVKAVASVADYSTFKHNVDDDSIDIGFAQRGGNGTIRSPRLEAQLKCTARNIIDDEKISYPLEIKNYNDLRVGDTLVPRILIVVLVPDSEDEWLQQSEEELVMHKCGYWISLRDKPATENENTITVHLPRTQIFDVEALNKIMDRISQGELP